MNREFNMPVFASQQLTYLLISSCNADFVERCAAAVRGCLHRLHDNKSEVHVYDYADVDGAYAGSHVPEEACSVLCARLYGCRGCAELMPSRRINFRAVVILVFAMVRLNAYPPTVLKPYMIFSGEI
jgi:hypothetical protein